jgi:hypothetical protein
MGIKARRLPLLASAVAVTAALGASPASAMRGTVLSATGDHVQMVTNDHVRGYRSSRTAGLEAGSVIRFSVSGGRIHDVSPLGKRARRISFTGSVVSYSSSGLVLRLGDGALTKFSARRVERACAPATPKLQVGEKLRVRELLAHGAYRLVLQPRGGACAGVAGPPTGPGAGPSAPIQQAVGVVTAIDTSDVVVQQPNGSRLTLNAPADAIDGLSSSGTISLSICETVAVSYQQSSGGLALDSLAITGESLVGCVEGDSVSLLVVGTLASAGDSTFTLNVPGQGALTLGQDPGNPATDGLDPGDQVLVTYTLGSGGTLLAVDASDDIQYATGTVTALAADGGQVRDWTTGTVRQFVADGAGFENASTGDAVGVAYYASASGLEAESVDDLTNGTAG